MKEVFKDVNTPLGPRPRRIVNASRIPPGPGMLREAGNSIEGVYVGEKVGSGHTGKEGP